VAPRLALREARRSRCHVSNCNFADSVHACDRAACAALRVAHVEPARRLVGRQQVDQLFVVQLAVRKRDAAAEGRPAGGAACRGGGRVGCSGRVARRVQVREQVRQRARDDARRVARPLPANALAERMMTVRAGARLRKLRRCASGIRTCMVYVLPADVWPYAKIVPL
jgi:hypothetical protein